MEGLTGDPAYRYAEAVLSGRETAAPSIVAAARRFLDDLERWERKAYWARYDVARGAGPAEFCSDYLSVKSATSKVRGRMPFHLLPWQQFVVRQVYGWIVDDRHVPDPLRRESGTRRSGICTCWRGRVAGRRR